MESIRVDCFYTREHQWVWVNGGTAFVGITDYAQRRLGNVLSAVLPLVGDRFMGGEIIGSIQSVAGRTELYMPLTGEVVKANEALINAPEQINRDPYGEGWLVAIAFADPDHTAQLLSAAEYEEYIKRL